MFSRIRVKTGRFAITSLVTGFMVAMGVSAENAAEKQGGGSGSSERLSQFQLTRYVEPAGVDQLSIECQKSDCWVVHRSNGDELASLPIPPHEVKSLIRDFFKGVSPPEIKDMESASRGNRKLASYEIRDESAVFSGTVSDSILDEKTGQPSRSQVKIIDSLFSIEGKLLARLQTSSGGESPGLRKQ